MYPHIYEISPATRSYRKIKQQYTVHLPYRFRAAENAVCRSRSTVHKFKLFTTLLQTSKLTQVSAFSSTAHERPLLKVYFLKRLEMSPFCWRWFCWCTINRLGHAFRCTQNIFTNRTLIPIYSACSFAEISEKLLLLHVLYARAEHFQE